MSRMRITRSYDYNTICDECGFKRKASEMRQRWDGFMVCADTCWEPRHPLDFYRTRNDAHRIPWTRPNPSDTLTYIPGFGLNLQPGQRAVVTPTSASTFPVDFPVTLETMVYFRGINGITQNNISRSEFRFIFRIGQTGYGDFLWYNTTNGNRYRMPGGTYLIPTNRWVRITAVFKDATHGTVYLNYLDSTNTLTTITEAYVPSVAASSGAAGDLTFGPVDSALTETFDGVIDDFRIWNTERSSSDVTTYWNTVLPSTTTGLVSNFRFDEGVINGIPSATTADSVISQSATLQGATYFPHMMAYSGQV